MLIGSAFLCRELGVEFPAWIFTWKTLLIVLGFFVIVKSKFRSFGGLLLVLVGSAFVISDIYPELVLRPLLWPIVLIIFGLIVIFKPRRKKDFSKARMHFLNKDNRYNNHGYQHCETEYTEQADDDRIESVTVFGAVKKNILSKNFKGGDIVNVFGGTEINLSQADFEGSPTLEVTNVFGGTTLIIPPNWEIIHSEAVSVLGSIEDKRPRTDAASEKNKVLILRGVVFMGGIEIKSYK